MLFSKACEYSIRAVTYIAGNSLLGQRVNLKEISARIHSPEAFTAKILQELVRQDIIRSVKGISGGFEMDVSQLDNITLGKVVQIIDGHHELTQCMMGLSDCSESVPCPMHDQFREIRNKLNHMMKHTTVRTLAERLNNGTVFLKI